MSPEELEEYEKSIPEWKKGALVVQSKEQKAEEAKGMYGKFKDKVSSTDAAKKFYQSDEYDKLKSYRNDYQEFKGNLKEQLENSQNPSVQKATMAYDYVGSESSCARAILNMEQYDTDFDLHEFE